MIKEWLTLTYAEDEITEEVFLDACKEAALSVSCSDTKNRLYCSLMSEPYILINMNFKDSLYEIKISNQIQTVNKFTTTNLYDFNLYWNNYIRPYYDYKNKFPIINNGCKTQKIENSMTQNNLENTMNFDYEGYDL